MNHALTCTTEELALLVTVCGYPAVAKGIAEASYGEKSPEEWDAIMESTIHQLVIKSLWDPNKTGEDEHPLSEEMQIFIKQYVESKWMIRCSNMMGRNVLMIHHFEEDIWLAHVIAEDIMHEFALLSNDEIPTVIKDFYSFEGTKIEGTQEFFLTDNLFDWLSDQSKTEKVRKKAKFTPTEEQSINLFTEDLEEHEWSLYNISHFEIPNIEGDFLLANIVFFLPSTKGMWIVEYIEDAKNPVHIKLNTYEEWHEMLDAVGSVAAAIEV
ncbi:hypothetical protein [Fredinandcohnia onubensis]|uniref:hypothetical protein n=1 Tax=Fredinandcohnia onubensis TaxID=1571209 RepID=UPI000C0C04DA|nr:hypothetical protein [Fredinandcohnia onubensis]